MQRALWKKYIWERQTAKQLAKRYGRSERWIRQQLDKHVIVKPLIKPCSTVIVADMTFVKRTFGICIFRAPHLKKNLAWKMALKENAEIYHELRWELEKRGFEVQAAVIDGKPGLAEVFWDVPIQMCQFHQIAIMTRYLTTRPRLPAGQILRQIALLIPRSDEEIISKCLDNWHEYWQGFLKEKTHNPLTGRWFYTHKRIRSAYRSIRKNLPILNTYKKYPELRIPNTTNSLDGSHAHLKDMLRIHRGLKRARKLKLIDEILSK